MATMFASSLFAFACLVRSTAANDYKSASPVGNGIPTYTKWIVGGPGVSCDVTCPSIGGECAKDDFAWPRSESDLRAQLENMRYECSVMASRMALYDPSAEGTNCSWKKRLDSTAEDRCAAIPPPRAVRFCACELLEFIPKARTLKGSPLTAGAAPLALYQMSFLFSHDAATGFMGSADMRRPIYQTQTLNLINQLECGVRSMDLRLAYYSNSKIHFTHSPGPGLGKKEISWISDQTVASEIPKIVAWASSRPHELVILVISHCLKGGTFTWDDMSCDDPVIVKAFTDLGVRVETSCATINRLTPVELSQGQVLMIPGEGYCVQANFDDRVTKIDEVEPYVERTMANRFQSMFQVQTLLQQKSITVPLKSVTALNRMVLGWINGGTLLKGVNLLEINLACAYGSLISQGLGANVTQSEHAQCSSSCLDACKRFGACHQMSSPSIAMTRFSPLSFDGIENASTRAIYT